MRNEKRNVSDPFGTSFGTFPLTGQSLVVKPFDRSQTLWPGKPRNVLPFLVAFQYLHENRAWPVFRFLFRFLTTTSHPDHPGLNR